MNRRRFLTGALGGGLLAGLPWRARIARAIGDDSRLRIAQLQIPGASFESRAGALRRLLREVEKVTSVEVDLEPVSFKADSDKLGRHPFLYLAGDREFPPLPARHIEQLRRFLTFGGFLVIDSAEGRLGGGFDTSVRRLVGDLFPRPARGLEPVPKDHVLYKSFYLLEEPPGRLLLTRDLEAVFHDKRAAIVYNQNDMSGAWMRDNLGDWTFECYPGGERQRELSFRLGVNLVMYALCLDYKTDQVHIPFILKRRQWRPDEP